MTIEIENLKTEICSVPDCDNALLNKQGKYSGGKGLCSKHYQRFFKYGTTDDPPKKSGVTSPGWKGGRLDARGYVRVWIAPDDPAYPYATAISKSSRYMLEHRLVMSRLLRRPLTKDETVHHLNGVKNDNRPENLELWSKSQPSGQRVVDKIAWAREILLLYRNIFIQADTVTYPISDPSASWNLPK